MIEKIIRSEREGEDLLAQLQDFSDKILEKERVKESKESAMIYAMGFPSLHSFDKKETESAIREFYQFHKEYHLKLLL